MQCMFFFFPKECFVSSWVCDLMHCTICILFSGVSLHCETGNGYAKFDNGLWKLQGTHIRFKWRFQHSSLKQPKVDVLEKGVGFDLCGPLGLTSQAQAHIFLQELIDIKDETCEGEIPYLNC